MTVGGFEITSLMVGAWCFYIGYRILNADPSRGARRCSFIQHPVIWLLGERRLDPADEREPEDDKLRRRLLGMGREQWKRHDSR